MPNQNDGPHSAGAARGLVILADGALLAERNAQLKENGEAFLDFRSIPGLIAEALGGTVEPDKEKSYFFQVGARSAETFIASISSAWTVHSFPMRAYAASCQCGKPSVRFSPAIGWALGNVSGRGSQDVVVCVSSDPGLVMPIRYTRDQGVDVYMAWMAPVGEEVRYFASRMDVPLLVLEAAERQMQKAPQTFGQSFLKVTAPTHSKEPGRSRPRRG